MTTPFINDGYTEKGYIPAMGEVPAIRFTFRPTTKHQLNQCLEKTNGKKDTEAGGVEAMEIAKKIVEWNIVDGNGTEWPIKAENLLKLRPPIYNRLAQIVLYGLPSDIDPDAPRPTDPEIKALLEAAGGVEGSQKNS